MLTMYLALDPFGAILATFQGHVSAIREQELHARTQRARLLDYFWLFPARDRSIECVRQLLFVPLLKDYKCVGL